MTENKYDHIYRAILNNEAFKAGPGTTQLNVRVSVVTKQRLRQLADLNDSTMSKMANLFINAGMTQYEDELKKSYEESVNQVPF